MMTKKDHIDQEQIQFLNLVGHEIRNPLNIIQGMAGLLEDEICSEAAKKKLDAIAQSSDRLVSIVEDAVDAANLMEGNLELQQSPIDLKKDLDKLKSKYARHASNKGLELLFEIDGQLSSDLYGDNWAIKRLSDILLNNALKFTEQGFIKVTASQNENVLQLEVSDSGRGIAERDRDLIFRAYAQVDSSKTRNGEGLGVGLYLAKMLCQTLGAQLDLKSEIGMGSTFILTLPLEVKPMEKTMKGKKKRTKKGLKILIVEDDPGAAEIIGLQLRELDCAITHVADGKSAVEAIKTEIFDVVLMDMRLPEEDGYHATNDIRNFEKETGLDPALIIAVTADAMKGDRERCLQAGCDKYISKPYRKDDLIAAIRD